MNKNIMAVIEQFGLDGNILEATPYGNGYINDTYAITCQLSTDRKKRYILQRINHEIFKNPEQLMQNFRKITEYLRERIIENGGDSKREALSIVPTLDHQDYYKDESGNYWRVLAFIEQSITYEVVSNADDFYRTAKTFGNFQRLLKDFPASSLYETIPNFHNTIARYETFLEAVTNNKSGRAQFVQKEIDFIVERKNETASLLNLLNDDKLPLKVTHNDTKLSNILMDENTNAPLCVIDLDTIMPGLAAYDFGDSIRAGACWTAEDEKDLTKVFMDLELYEAFAKGFIEGAQDGLSKLEIQTLPIGAKTITLEQGIRFLTDYLDGDLYYKTTYSEQNLDRARTQLKLVSDMETKWDKMNEIIERYL